MEPKLPVEVLRVWLSLHAFPVHCELPLVAYRVVGHGYHGDLSPPASLVACTGWKDATQGCRLSKLVRRSDRGLGASAKEDPTLPPPRRSGGEDRLRGKPTTLAAGEGRFSIGRPSGESPRRVWTRSAIGLCQGLRYAVRTGSIPKPLIAATTFAEKIESRSRRR